MMFDVKCILPVSHIHHCFTVETKDYGVSEPKKDWSKILQYVCE